MMDSMMKMKMKEKLLDELLEQFEGEDAMKLKPKDESVEMTAVSLNPEDEDESPMDTDDAATGAMNSNGKMSSEGAPIDGPVGMDDEDLKKLMMSYMGK